MSAAAAAYGYDLGRPDADLPANDDSAALLSHGEVQQETGLPPLLRGATQTPQPPERYYASPVAVCIPDSLEPLPPLLQNPMNLLYFHYFLNYTAKILVTHECSSNPFRTVLPSLAVRDENLLSLLLAYAACHRARLLNHGEPVNRIAGWVTKVFPTFRQALADDSPITEAVFGTAVMLASLSLSYPMAFDFPELTWRDHLSVASQLSKLRSTQETPNRKKAATFFSRWFAYLDTFGSLSGKSYEGSYQNWSPSLLAAGDDCLTGYTTQSLVLLSRAADIARRCDRERKSNGYLSAASLTAAQQLRQSLELACLEAQHKRYICRESSSASSSSNAPTPTVSSEVYQAVNGALCNAALISLYRRVYHLPSASPLVQSAVTAILSVLEPNEYRHPVTIDIPDIILPLFLVGCEAQRDSRRHQAYRSLERIGSVGMAQTSQVCALLETCWLEQRDWRDLDHDVFLG